MGDIFSAVFQRPNFLTFCHYFFFGDFYIMVTRYNLVKKLVGMYLVQTSVIFFLVSISSKKRGDRSSSVVHDRSCSSQFVCQSLTTCVDTHGHCRRSGHVGCGVGFVCGHLSKIWQS